MLRFLRSLLAGGLATFVDLGVLAMLVSVIGMSPRHANVPALLAGAVVQFFANRHFVFRAREGSIAKQAALFIVVEAIALLANALLYDQAMRLVAPSLYAIARLVTSNLVYVLLSYPLWRFVFQTRRQGAWTRSPSSPRIS